MAINRIVKINLDAANANQGIDALEAKLKRLDNAFSSVSTVSSSSFSGITPAAASSGKAVDNATKSLEKYQGTLDNVSRTTLQSSNNLTKQERATLNYDTATRKLNKALEEGKIDQDAYNKSIERAEARFNDLSKAASRSGSGLQQYSGYLSNSDRILKELEKNTSILAQTELKYDVAKRKLNQSLEKGVISSEDYSSSLKQLDRQQQTSVAQAEKMDKAFRGSFGGASATMGQLGLQAQDVAVQMQMGTSAAIIFAQQGSQILSAFGPMGAILGTVAAGIGLVATMTGDADTNMKDFNASIAELDAVSFDAKGSVQGLGKSIADLSTNNQVQSTADLGAAFFNAANLIEQSGNTIAESINQAANGWTLRDFKDASDALDNIGLSASEAARLYQSYLDTSQGSRYLSYQTDQARLVTQELTEMGKALGLSKDETIEFADAALKINGNATADEINAASSSLIGFIKNMQNSKTLTTEQSANLSSLIAELIRTGQSINQLNSFQEKYAVLQERINSNLDSFVSKKATNNALIGGFGTDADAIGIIDDIIDREEELTNLLKTNLEFTEERLQAQLNKDVIDIISNEAIELDNIAKAEELIISLQEKGLKLTKDQVSAIKGRVESDIYKKATKESDKLLRSERDRLEQISMSKRAIDQLNASREYGQIIQDLGLKKGSKAWKDVQKDLIKSRELIDQYYDTIQQRQTDEEWDITGLTALRNQIAEIEKEFGANSELAKKQKAMVYSSFFDGAREGLMAAIASGDFSSVGESIGLSISNAISKGVSQAITKDLSGVFSSSMSSEASGLAAGALGAVGGAVVGGLVGGILAGSKTTLKGEGYRIGIESGEVFSAELSKSFKKSSFLGSSSWTEYTDLTIAEFDSLANSINQSSDSMSVAARSLGGSVSRFTGVLSNKDGSLADGIAEYTNRTAEQSFAAIEKFKQVGETFEETFINLGDIARTVNESLKITGIDVISNRSAQIQNRAAELKSQYEKEYQTALDTEFAVASQVISRAITGDKFNQEFISNIRPMLQEGLSEGLRLGDIVTMVGAGETGLTEGMDGFGLAGVYSSIRKNFKDLVAAVENSDEILSRVGDTLKESVAEYNDRLITSLAEIENVSKDDAKGLLSSLSQSFAENYLTEQERLENSIANAKFDFISLGFSEQDLNASKEQVKAFYDQVGSPEERAKVLSAADALAKYNSAIEDQNEAANEAAEAIKAHTDAMLKSAYSTLQDQLGLAFSSLIDHIEDKISAIEDRISKKRGILDALNETASVIREENKRRDWNNSQAALSAALITARSTGMLPTDIDSILSGFQSPTADMFGSATELERARGIAANDIAELQDITQDQLDTDEKMLMQLENSMQIYKDQYNQLVGINDKLLTFEGSLLAFQELIGINTKEPSSGSSVTNDDIRWTIDQAVSRLGAGEEAWNYLYQRAKDYGVSISRIEEFIPGAEDWVKSQGLPMFANGGVFTNSIVDKPTMFNMGVMGEAGPEAIVPLHMGSEGLGIKNYSAPMPTMQSSSSESVANEIKESRKENAMLMQQLLKKTTNIERNTQTIKNIKQEEMA